MTAVATRPARAAALARQEQQIAANVEKIEAAKRPSALDVMASRLNITPSGLKNTLMNTVFRVKTSDGWRSPSDDEFAALVIVANEYKLNPLTKEIYAYPAKGGGIVPIVSIDGWVRIMNEHPAFDGIEFTDIPGADGKLLAIEAVIYRKDRSRPVRVVEYLSECKQNTDPWRNMPARMLRHKATIQGARYAFGFSGIYSEGDTEILAIGPMVEARNVTPAPTRAQVATIAHDPETGEIVEDAQEGPDDSQRGEVIYDPNTGAEVDPREAIAIDIEEAVKAAATIIDLKKIVADRLADIDLLPDEMAGAVNKAIRDAEARLKGGAQ